MLFPLAFFWLSIFAQDIHLERLEPIYTVYADQIEPLWDATTTMDVITSLSDEYHVSSSTMLAVVTCETAGNLGSTTIQSFAMDRHGNRENSWGLSQIDLDYHPDITKEQAQNPIFALTYLADNLSKGNGDMWTCFKMMK